MFESDFMGYLKMISFRCQQREQETGPEILTCKVKKEKRLENSMSKKYKQLAREIIEKAGGKDNISDVCHCQTWLRFKLKDEAKASDQALKDMDEVPASFTIQAFTRWLSGRMSPMPSKKQP